MVKGRRVKAIWLLGLLALLLTIAYDKVAGTSEGTARSGAPLVVAATAATGSGLAPARLADYALLHRTRDEGISLRAMTAAFSCPE